MARLPRVVVIDVPHHVTQRGNAQQVIFAQNADRVTYLELLRQYSQLYGLSLLGYCLMSNHVHLIVAPHAATALANTLKHTHGRYASYWNACQSSTGHVWQGRFYSCPLDDAHPWEALRYTELNPVRAGLGTDGTFPSFCLTQATTEPGEPGEPGDRRNVPLFLSYSSDKGKLSWRENSETSETWGQTGRSPLFSQPKRQRGSCPGGNRRTGFWAGLLGEAPDNAGWSVPVRPRNRACLEVAP